MSSSNSEPVKSPKPVDKRSTSPKDRPVRRGRPPGSGSKPAPKPSASREAKRLATAILEVLAGQRTPSDAAEALGISLPRYYVLEQRAMEGLLVACESRTKGPGHSAEKRIAEQQRQIDRLARECARQQALVRVAGRTVGLCAAGAEDRKVKKSVGKTRRRRRPTARALKAAARLKIDSESPTPSGADGSDALSRTQAC